MPHQVSNVSVTDNGDGTVGIQIGPFGHTRPVSYFFDRSTEDYDAIKANIGLAFRIGGYAVPNASEFVDFVNKNAAGMEGVAGKVFIMSIDDEGDGNYRIQVGRKQGQTLIPTFGIPVTLDYLNNDSLADETIIGNLRQFLRLNGNNSLNAAAISAVAAAKFWK